MTKKKKIIGLAILTIIFLLSVGVLYWKNQQEIQEADITDETSKKIPEGIEIAEQPEGIHKIINSKDNYNFTLSESWEEVGSASHYPKETLQDRTVSHLRLLGETLDQEVTISKFENDSPDINIRDWTDRLYSDFDLDVDSSGYKIGDIEGVIITATDETPLISFFFKKESSIYSITCEDKETIEDIIISGEW